MSSPLNPLAGTRGARHVPPVAVSSTSTLVTRTGSWKYIRPAYHDRVAPCNQGCPVGIDIEGYMNLLREGRVGEARELLLAENPMPATTGRVCHHPCESACNRQRFDAAVAIHAVERMLGDLRVDESVVPCFTHRERVAVVGSGPAGLACAWHLARFGYPVTVFEAAHEPGGMLRLGIPEYRLPRAVLDRDIDRIRAAGVEIRCGVRAGLDVAWADLHNEFDAIFLASGAHVSRDLGVPGEDGPGIRPGLDFLKEINAGATPDLGGDVVVVGGGNTAMDCARTAVRLGATVTVLYRRTRDEMPAIREEIEGAEREGVTFVFLAAPVEFRFAGGQLAAVECERMALGAADASGRRTPVATGERFLLAASTVLTAIGEVLDGTALPSDVARRSSGVPVDPLGGTNLAAVFAGGDVTEATRSVADALGAGKRAAIGIDHFLQHQALAAARREAGVVREGNGHVDLSSLRFADGNLSAVRWTDSDPIARVAPLNAVVPFEDLNVEHFTRVPRRPDRVIPDRVAVSGFSEVNLGLTDREAMDEARRCFNCGVCTQCDLCLIFCPDVAISHSADGAYDIALDYCKGCGVCAAECPRGAITMTRDDA